MKHAKSRTHRPRCGVCQSHGIVIYGFSPYKADHRPMFRCTQCKHEWTQGTSGGEYTQVALAYMKKNKIPVPPNPPPPMCGWCGDKEAKTSKGLCLGCSGWDFVPC